MKPTLKSKPPVIWCLSALHVWRMQTLAAAKCLSHVIMHAGLAAPRPFDGTCAGRGTCIDDEDPNGQAKSGVCMACRVFVNQMLSGVQQRNLERTWGRPVVDRMGLIIDIFAQRARTKEAQLQVASHACLHAPSPREVQPQSRSWQPPD